MRPLSGDVHPASIPTRPARGAESPLHTSTPSARRTSALPTPSRSPRPTATRPQVLLSSRNACVESARPFGPETNSRRPVGVAPPAVCHDLPNLPARPVHAGRPSSLHLHIRVVQTLDLEDEVRESGIDRIRRRAADAPPGGRGARRFLTGAVCVSRGPRRASRRRRA